MMLVLANSVAAIVLPFLITGLLNRVKSLWSGRKGPPLFQSAYDVLRLLRKTPVYSATTTPVFRIAPWACLVTALSSSLIVPLLGIEPSLSFPFDFVWFAYVWGFGRMALMLAGLDVGSSFEGMGVAREATFSSLMEPGLFVVCGALCLSSGSHTLSDALLLRVAHGDASVVVRMFSIITLFVLLQVEGARMPVDDPSTHLELTMIHEVIVLDHSGPELAAIQYGAMLKLFIAVSLVATLLNPIAGAATAGAISIHLALCTAVTVLLGTIESLIARFRLRLVPLYIAGALASAVAALLATMWRTGAVP